ncbi:MAG: DUF115 domain-containing protein [Candidatus Rhabdochlamydia sp.]
MLDKYAALELELRMQPFSFALEEIHYDAKDLKVQKLLRDATSISYDALYLYKISKGIPFITLEAWLEENSKRQLIFLEEDLYEVHKTMNAPWGEKLFSHPRVHVYRLPQEDDDLLEYLAEKFPCENIGVFTLEKRSAKMRRLEVALLRKTVLFHSVVSEILSGPVLHQNMISNLKKLPQSFYVNQTAGAFKDLPAIICGAGPSLETVAKELKELQDKVLIIGCGSALSALSHLGIRPHLGIALDPNPRERECLQGCQERDIPLIYGTRLYPTVFELFDGPYGYLRSPSVTSLERLIEEELGFTEEDIGEDLGREALSVTTLALSLASFWGCSSVALAGVDLAFREGEHYSKGVHLKASFTPPCVGEKRLQRQSVYGKTVMTQLKWIMEQETIDAYTKNYPHITFTHAAQEGLGFSRIPYQSLSLLKQMPTHLISKSIEAMIKNHPLSIDEEKIHQTLNQIGNSFTRCLELLSLLKEEKEGSGKAILYEEDLLEEKVYIRVLKPALEAIEKVHALQQEAPLGRRKWTLLHEMVLEYKKLFL